MCTFCSILDILVYLGTFGAKKIKGQLTTKNELKIAF